MQQLSLDELKQVLFHAFRDHLTMKDIENIIITEEESLNENSGNCPEYEGGEEPPVRETNQIRGGYVELEARRQRLLQDHRSEMAPEM